MKEKLLTIMFTLFCLAAAGQENQNTSTLVGDANGDGKVNAADIVEVVNYIDNNPSALFKFENADFNEDLEINNQDLDFVRFCIMLPSLNTDIINENKICYCVLPLEKGAGWDSLMVASNGFFSLMRTNSDGTKTIAIGIINAKDFSKTVFFKFTEDMTPLSILAEKEAFFFVNHKENTADIFYEDDGDTFFIQDVQLPQRHQNSRAVSGYNSGVSQNTYWEKINIAYSIGSLIQNVTKVYSEDDALSFFINGFTTVSANDKRLSPEAKLYISMTGNILLSGNPIIGSVGVLLTYADYFEAKDNQYKKEMYHDEAGDCEIETLDPEFFYETNTYHLGVKVRNAYTIPQAGKTNTFGLILQKVIDGNIYVNLYNRDTNIFFEYDLESDGEFYKDVRDLEPGETYVCRAFILPAKEKERLETGKNSFYNSHNSYAYYGEVIEFTVKGPKRKITYKNISAENTNEDKVHFKFEAEVDVVGFSNEIEKWGVRMKKDNTKYDLSDYIEKIYLRSGTPSYNPAYNPAYWKGDIEFDADKSSLTIDKDKCQAITKDHWEIGTYVLYDEGSVKRESLSFIPLDLVYSETPEAKTLDMSTPTKVTSATVECEFNNFGLWEGKCGVEYWKEDGQYLEKYVDASQNGKYSIELTGLSPFTSYKYRAFVKVNDSYYRAQETKDFVTQYCKPKYKGCEIIEKCYDYKNYHYKDKTYSYKFHIATSWEIETLDNIVDWGYKYIDLENKPEPISLMMFGKSYKDSRYAYYRNDRETEIKLLPYSKHGKSSAGSRMSVTRNSDGDEDGYVYGDTITIKLIYDHQPVATTFEPLSIAETMATVKCGFKDAAPWEGICGVEYWSDDNHLQKTIVNNADGEVEIELTNLLPNTTYQYRSFIKVGSEFIWAEETKSFTTKNVQIQLCPDDHHPHWIDLGLPSGTLWRCCNEGASTPEAYGGYYEFGQVASAPSCDQIKELLDYTTSEWTIQDGVNGRRFISSNGGSIFLPAAGLCLNGEIFTVGWNSYYWSSTHYDKEYVYALVFFSNEVNQVYYGNLDNGLSVRPVSKN